MRAARAFLIGTAWVLFAASVSFPAETEKLDRYRILDAAKAAAKDIRGQADALARLAWPDGEPADFELASLARDQLVGFGKHAIPSLRTAVTRVKPLYSADVTSALTEARLRISAGIEPDYFPALEDALWFGSVDAKRLAIPEVARFRVPAALLFVIDAAYDHPELRELAIESLPKFRSDRSRFFLRDVLRTGNRVEREMAAAGLAQVGGQGTDMLREAALSPERPVREPAIAALLAIAAPDDLSILHEYGIRYPDDDPVLLEQIRERASQLEHLLEAQQAQDSASPSIDY